MSILFTWILLKGNLAIRRMISVFLSFTGVLIIAGLDLSFKNSSMLLGAFLCIMCAVSFVLTTVILIFTGEKINFGFG